MNYQFSGKSNCECDHRAWTKGDVMLAYEVITPAFKTWCGAELNCVFDDSVAGQGNQSKENSVKVNM